MAEFPSDLIPVGRTFTAGVYPHTALMVLNGRESRIRHSSTVVGHSLRVMFALLTTAEMLEISDHYAGQLGGFLPFTIPDDLLSGIDAPEDITPTGHRWLYAGPPTVEDVPLDEGSPLNRHNVEVELTSIPLENAIASGARFRVRIRWQPGAIITLGIPRQFVIPITWSPGVASALAPGITITASVGWAAGRPLHAPGIAATAMVTWEPGGIMGQLLQGGIFLFPAEPLYLFEPD